jgi:hypothetical protein
MLIRIMRPLRSKPCWYLGIIMSFLFFNICQAQKKEGFLIRCYNSRTMTVDFSNSFFLFSVFLQKGDLMNITVDSFFIENTNHDYLFSVQLNRMFKTKLQFIKTVPKGNEIVDPSCKLKPVLLDSCCSDDWVKRIVIDSDYNYVIRINKVTIESCGLKKVSDFDELFEHKIGLKTIVVTDTLAQSERRFFNSVFDRISPIRK